MKRIIDGVTYNTDTATLVARYDYIDMKEIPTAATVHQTRGGAFFIVHRDGKGTDARHYFEAIGRDELDRLIEKTDNIEIIDNAILQDPPEATATSKTDATVFLRVPAALKRRLDEAAQEAQQSTNAHALKCVELCLSHEELKKDLAAIWHTLTALTLTPEQFNKPGAVAIAGHAEDLAKDAMARLGVSEADDTLFDYTYSPSGRFVNWSGREFDHLHEEGWKNSGL